MASPAIPHSKSAPDITSPRSPPHHPPSNNWPKKLGDLFNEKTSQSILTAESLEEFNRRNDVIEDRISSYISPYYKGLTDFSLVINREKLSGSSPGRESRATSYVTSNSRSSFVVKVQEWGSSCFTSKGNETTLDNRFPASSSRVTEETVEVTKIRSTRTTNEPPEPEKKRLTVSFTKNDEGTIMLPETEKPLRERDSESPYILPLPQPAASPPESLPYPLPQITAQEFISPLPISPLSDAPPSPSLQVVYPSPQPPVQTPPPKTPIANKNKEISYVWSDNYRPALLQEFICNKEKALLLKNIVKSWHDTAEECGHFIFEGNPGVGKRTMIWSLLREAFGEDKVQTREECKKFYLKGEAVSSILVNLSVSPQHVEVNLSELKGYEKHVIVELIKEKSPMLTDITSRCNEENCKAIILYEADKLSTDTLSYIKWMLEKFKGCNKVFFCCSDAKKLQPLIPLCRHIQLNEPSIEEIVEVLTFIAKKEGIQLPPPLACKIANNSKNNLRQAIRSFEATWHFNGCNASLTEDQDIKTGWEDKIANIARNVLEEQSPKQLYNIRGELQNLIEHNVAPEFIFQTLKGELKWILPEQLQPQFEHLYVEYQKNNSGKNYSSSPNQEEESSKKQNDQRKNVQQFMRIEGKASVT
ncbi:hypothetical protein ACS0TY_019805 [Phlomoides rotata]